MKLWMQIVRCVQLILVVVLAACAAQKSNKTHGDTRTKPVLYIDDRTYLLTEHANDPSYAWKKSNPVKVGSKEGRGPLNELRFLNALLGPNGEEVRFVRIGSCCPFKTPNAVIGNKGLLDHYRIFWEGARDTLDIYINMYDEGDLKIPVGLTAKKKS